MNGLPYPSNSRYTILTFAVLNSQIVIYLERVDTTQPVVLPESLSNGVKMWYQVWKEKWENRDVSDRIETGNLEVSHDYWLAIRLKLGRPDSVLTKVCIDSCSKLLDELGPTDLGTLWISN